MVGFRIFGKYGIFSDLKSIYRVALHTTRGLPEKVKTGVLYIDLLLFTDFYKGSSVC